MILNINHTTQYKYDNEVILNPHILYLLPQYRTYFKQIEYRIKITPNPVSVSSLIDLENNAYLQCWFTGYTQELEVKLDIKVQSDQFNPFNFIYDNTFRKTNRGFEYTNKNNILLKAYLQPCSIVEIYEFTQNIYQSVNDVINFLTKVVEKVHIEWNHIIREEIGFLSPAVTFQTRSGSCRDLATMLIAMLHSVGLAARYVSGYAFNELLADEHNLHAWVETYIPGAGWIGLDPSLGLFTDFNYFPLVSSVDHSMTAPIIGTFGGSA
ncbi:MAG TPA: transglutaminase family protein, partial [Saprospiraceae bacterium]|nr:transglutaminase family protein [Saprospiraceae bacterium]